MLSFLFRVWVLIAENLRFLILPFLTHHLLHQLFILLFIRYYSTHLLWSVLYKCVYLSVVFIVDHYLLSIWRGVWNFLRIPWGLFSINEVILSCWTIFKDLVVHLDLSNYILVCCSTSEFILLILLLCFLALPDRISHLLTFFVKNWAWVWLAHGSLRVLDLRLVLIFIVKNLNHCWYSSLLIVIVIFSCILVRRFAFSAASVFVLELDLDRISLMGVLALEYFIFETNLILGQNSCSLSTEFLQQSA